MEDQLRRLGIIGGSGFREYRHDRAVFLLRHGDRIPPHRVDHLANIRTLKEAGADSVIGICSVGSVNQEIPPLSIVIPDDYIGFDTITCYDEQAVHTVPGFDSGLRQRILEAAVRLGIAVRDRGVYWQTRGPRYETEAEIRLIAHFADVVGMTMAHEATIAKEMGVRYAAICAVDNYGNGLSRSEGPDVVTKNQALNIAAVRRLLDGLLLHPW
jgi:5'-methylthioadenosine phosphorylase